MQKYARSEEGQTLFVTDANKKSTYSCLSCNAPMRLRGGPLRMPHFYHITKACHPPKATSKEHIQVQKALLTMLTHKGALMEKPFPLIQRIADIALPNERLIFEVQCSKISKKELQRRNREYGELGLTVVWILHDQIFNRTPLSAAERTLIARPHYYTNIDQEGKGIIYDQFVLSRGKRRIYKGRRLKVDLSRPTRALSCKQATGELGYQLRLRKKRWRLAFWGDLYHQKIEQSKNCPRPLKERLRPTAEFLLLLYHRIKEEIKGRMQPKYQPCAKRGRRPQKGRGSRSQRP